MGGGIARHTRCQLPSISTPDLQFSVRKSDRPYTEVAPNVESYLQTPGHSHRLTFIQQQKAISKVESKWCHD